MSPGDRFVVDLSNCDREPIHIPGAIQPHGVLLALEEPALIVTQVSDSVRVHLALDTGEVLGRPLADLLDPPSLAAVGTALAEGRWDEHNPMRLEVRGRRFDGIVHRRQGAAILELEPAAAAPDPRRHPLRQALAALQHADTLSDLADCLVHEVRRLTGFERVILYRFDEAGHGSVDAEIREEHLEPYLGLQYPASDIPQQARKLYQENWLRIIPDARYTPSALVPALRPNTGAPLDLSCAVLRSVSPIHLEYLANLGVRASMSISLVVRERLWGLISCANHSGPRLVPYEVRSACEVIGRLGSLQIAALEDRQAAILREARRPSQMALVAALRDSEPTADVLESLCTRPAELLGLVGASGAAVVGASDEPRTCGHTPSPALIAAIAAWADAQGDGGVFATRTLADHVPGAEAEASVASGVLTFALPGTPRRRLLWFRPEVVKTVGWGGDPRKPVLADPGQRLHPRRSFELWKEEVRGRARPWTPSDREAAEELRRNVVELDLERQVVREQRAVRARDDLVAVVSHDLKNPLGVIQMQATLLLRTTMPDAERSRRLRASAERIQRAVDHMNVLIADLLDLAKIEAGRFTLEPQPIQLDEVIAETLIIMRPLADAKDLHIAEQLVAAPRVAGDRERIFQVLSNLIGNAIKFTPPAGRITLRAERRDGEVVVSVADTGPGVPPEQRGHVFDRYWQARRSDRQGSGLGLFIAKGIVEAHGGRIWIEDAPERGARFLFTLPAA